MAVHREKPASGLRNITSGSSNLSGNARHARTDWRTLVEVDGTTLVEIQLHTGRTHQIRVHFSAIGHPVVGDTLYGAAPHIHLGAGTPRGASNKREETVMPAL